MRSAIPSLRPLLLAAAPALLGLAGCAVPSAGPVPPSVGGGAPGVVVIDPSLSPYLDVPQRQPVYRYNDQGLLQYDVVVRNRGPQAMTLAYTADEFDQHNSLLFHHEPTRFFIDPSSEYALQVMAANRNARSLRIQIRPAK